MKEINDKRVLTLPRIEHPSTRFNKDSINSLDIRGKSRNGFGQGELVRNESSFDRESSYSTVQRERRRSSICSSYSTINSFRDRNNSSLRTRLPIFGQNPSLIHSSIYENENEQESSIDLYLNKRILKDKVERQFNEIRRKFSQISNGEGKISRQALNHLISSIFGVQQQIKGKDVDKLVEDLHLKDLDKISFDDFIKSLSIEEKGRSTTSSSQINYFRPTAREMFEILREKYLNKDENLFEVLPQLKQTEKENIYKNQFNRALIQMDFHIETKQFDRLWDKFDKNGFNSVENEKFIERLINEENQIRHLTTESQDQQISILQSKDFHSSNANQQINDDFIEYLFNQRELKEFEKILEETDKTNEKLIERDLMIKLLSEFTLSRVNDLKFDRWLKSIDLESLTKKRFIPYRDIINRIQIKIKSNRQIYSINEEEDQQDFSTDLKLNLIGQIEYLIKLNINSVEKRLKQIDKIGRGSINNLQWKNFLEELIEYSLSPNEYEILKKHFPLDSNDSILWKDFLNDLSNKNLERKIFSEENKSKIPQWNYMRSNQIRQCLDLEHVEKRKLSNKENKDKTKEKSVRSFDKIRLILKEIVRQRYKDVEYQFNQIDKSSYGELTKDLLRQLFQRLSINPEINDDEIDLIWSNSHLKENGNLDFYQFLRQFGYSKGSAHFPNAKSNPPKRGDADFLLTSRKLYGDSVLVEGTTLNSIRLNWNLLRDDFILLDPYRTGFVQTDEFDDILSQCSPIINQEDLFQLKSKFQSKDQSRVNYLLFLKHHSPTKQINEQPTNQHFDRIFNEKIKKSLKNKEKSLQRSFKQEDSTNIGLVSGQTFRKILIQHQSELTDEDFYFLLSRFDPENRSLVNYRTFIKYIQSND